MIQVLVQRGHSYSSRRLERSAHPMKYSRHIASHEMTCTSYLYVAVSSRPREQGEACLLSSSVLMCCSSVSVTGVSNRLRSGEESRTTHIYSYTHSSTDKCTSGVFRGVFFCEAIRFGQNQASEGEVSCKRQALEVRVSVLVHHRCCVEL